MLKPPMTNRLGVGSKVAFWQALFLATSSRQQVNRTLEYLMTSLKDESRSRTLESLSSISFKQMLAL